MRKLGLLLMILVLALGTLGVGYSAWTDTITVAGTVNTGNVELTVKNYSGTWVYKTEPHEIEVISGWVGQVQLPVVGDPYPMLVASAIAEAGGEDGADVIMTFDNLFPGVVFCADFLVHYTGSVPAIVGADIASDSEWLNELWAMGNTGEGGAWAVAYWSDEFGREGALIEGPVQMHYCDYVIIKLCIEIPQDNRLMGLTGSFSGTITAVNWNEADHVFVP